MLWRMVLKIDLVEIHWHSVVRLAAPGAFFVG